MKIADESLFIRNAMSKCQSNEANPTAIKIADRVHPLTLAVRQAVIAQVTEEPVDIIRGVPQFFVDDWLVDNRFAVKYKHHAVVHRVHPPKKHQANPLYRGDAGYGAG